MIIIGIDPGLDGAIALLHPDTLALERILDIPTIGAGKQRIVNIALLYASLMAALPEGEPVTCWLEYAAARPIQSVSATFKQGRVYGILEAITVCMGWPLHVVTPGKWKQHFGLARREWSNAERKAASRAHATRMFPSHADLFVRVKDDGRAEAALIALYGAEKIAIPVEP